MLHYEEASTNVHTIFLKVFHEHFEWMRNAKILILIDTKKHLNKGKIALGRIQRANELTRYLSSDMAPDEGYDYVMFLDKKLVTRCEDYDIERVIRHELRHVGISETGKWGIVPHDFEDFEVEVELNKEDPNWAKVVANKIDFLYEAEADE